MSDKNLPAVIQEAIQSQQIDESIWIGILFVDQILEQGGKIFKQEKDEEGENVLVACLEQPQWITEVGGTLWRWVV